ncbi:hypothetical protein AVW11_35205 [Streptomyces amritsarensis]|uniref:Transposase IS701-like DDE domain-containing protein n=1 Tax=Streptomyces amritsarensis TaxID=681158 RepID=A0ABX3FRZ4_9ACTN|nr:transposase [Streptomyces amritsarensis]OLZ43564.1 hypothetical protein AVW11_35205 [Streptomyces amritsarensis]
MTFLVRQIVGQAEHGVQPDAFTAVTALRTELYASLLARGDALFELCDALLCTDGPVRTLVDLALAPEHRRGHGALYAGLNHGQIDIARLRRALVGVPLPRAADGRLVLAVDVSPWLRPDANTCRTAPSAGAWANTRWSGLAVLDRCRAGERPHLLDRPPGRDPAGAGADLAAVTAIQGREVVERLIAAGQWQRGQPDVLIVMDAGYDAPRIAHLLTDMPTEVLGRLRSDRVMRKPVPVPWI